MVLRLEKDLEKNLGKVPEYDPCNTAAKNACALTSNPKLQGGQCEGHHDGDVNIAAAVSPRTCRGTSSKADNNSSLMDDNKCCKDDDADDNGRDVKAYDDSMDDYFDENNKEEEDDDDDDNNDDDVDAGEYHDLFDIDDDIDALVVAQNDNDENCDENDDDDDYDEGNDDSLLDEDAIIPDGGWGWVVCFGSFMVNFISDGTMFSFGILLLDLLKDMGSDKATTSWAGGALVGCSMFAGPVVSYLLESYSLRQVTIAGAILTMIGFTASSFSVNVYMFILTYGVIGGTGIALSFIPAIIVVGLYFNKKRALATGIATSGSGLGTFAYAYIANGLLGEYNWRGTVMILGGLVLNTAVCGMVFRPISPNGLAAAAKKKAKLLKEEKESEEEILKQQEAHKDNGSASSGYSSDKALPAMFQQQERQPLLPSPLVVVTDNETNNHNINNYNDLVTGGGGCPPHTRRSNNNVTGESGETTRSHNEFELDHSASYLLNASGMTSMTSSASESSISASRDAALASKVMMPSSKSHHQALHSHRRIPKDTSGSLFRDAILNRQRRDKHVSESSSKDEYHQTNSNNNTNNNNINNDNNNNGNVRGNDDNNNSGVNDNNIITTIDNNSNQNNNNNNNDNNNNPDVNENLPTITINANTITTDNQQDNNINNNNNNGSNANSMLGDILGNCSIDTSSVITIEDMASGELVYHQLLQTPGSKITKPGNDNQPTDTADTYSTQSSVIEPDDRKLCEYDYEYNNNSEICQIRPPPYSESPLLSSTTKTNNNIPLSKIKTEAKRNGDNIKHNNGYDRLYQSAGHLYRPSKQHFNSAHQPHNHKTSQDLPSGYYNNTTNQQQHPFPNTRLLNSEYKLNDYPNNHLLGVTTPINQSPKIHSRSSGHLKGGYYHGSGHDMKLHGNTDMTASKSAYFQHQITKGLLRPILRQDIYYGGSVNHLTASKQFGSVASFVAAMTRASTESCDVISEKAESTRHRGRGLSASCCSSSYLFKNRNFVLLLITFTMWTAQSVSLTYIPDLAVSRGIARTDAAFLISIVGIANVLGRLLAGLVTDALGVPASWLYILALSTAAVINFTIAFGYSYILLCICSSVFGLCMGVAVSMRTIVLAEELGIQFLTQSFGIVAMFQGVAFTVNPPIAGKLIDDYQSFIPPFLMVAAMYAVSAMAVVAVVLLNKFKPIKRFTTTTNTSFSGSIIINANTNNHNDDSSKNNDHHLNVQNHHNHHHHQSNVLLGDNMSYTVEVASPEQQHQQL